jgi:hypothetical protein
MLKCQIEKIKEWMAEIEEESEKLHVSNNTL